MNRTGGVRGCRLGLGKYEAKCGGEALQESALPWQRVPFALTQPRPPQAADGMLAVDGTCLGEAARAGQLERVVAEDLA